MPEVLADELVTMRYLTAIVGGLLIFGFTFLLSALVVGLLLPPIFRTTVHVGFFHTNNVLGLLLASAAATISFRATLRRGRVGNQWKLRQTGGNHLKNAASGSGDLAQPFAARQIWTYRAREGEEKSRIIVCRVEPDAKLGEIVHIHVNGLRFRNRRAPGGFSDQIGHMPYAAEALRKSVLAMEPGEAELPMYEDGYKNWRSEFEEGKAGVWTAPVPEAIFRVEMSVNR